MKKTYITASLLIALKAFSFDEVESITTGVETTITGDGNSAWKHEAIEESGSFINLAIAVCIF